MLNRKAIVATLIVLLILVVLIFTNPTVGSFFGSVSDRISDFFLEMEQNVERKVFFTLSVDKYNEIKFRTPNVNIVLYSPKLKAHINGNEVEISTEISITKFRGNVKIVGDFLSLDGEFENLETTDKSIKFPTGSISTNTSFQRLVIENLAISKLDSQGITGTLKAGETSIQFSGDIKILYPKGKFVFEDGLEIDGNAQKISIPNENIVIGS